MRALMNTREHYLSVRYYDDVRFPYGFSKSGNFTISEAECLESKGAYFCALQEGRILELNQEDKRVLSVLNGDSEATTFEEKTWLKYIGTSKRNQVWLREREKTQNHQVSKKLDDNIDELNISIDEDERLEEQFEF